jgi:hypothetical protein
VWVWEWERYSVEVASVGAVRCGAVSGQRARPVGEWVRVTVVACLLACLLNGE